jgi:hypothetical protein
MSFEILLYYLKIFEVKLVKSYISFRVKSLSNNPSFKIKG